MSDLIKRADAIEAVASITMSIHLSDVICGKLLALPSANAVDCTDFIEWLVDRVLDETIWEYNSVAYGEIICRKLEKLGVLEVTEEPSYYIRPSAEAVQRGKRGRGMTREEAIKIIDCYDIGFYDLSGEKISADKLADAFDMAIEALSEPINCVKCKHYYETEDDTDVHGHCRMDTAHTNLTSRGEWVISIICLGALAVAVVGLLAKIKFLFL